MIANRALVDFNDGPMVKGGSEIFQTFCADNMSTWQAVLRWFEEAREARRMANVCIFVVPGRVGKEITHYYLPVN